jgi:hypothetical protein
MHLYKKHLLIIHTVYVLIEACALIEERPLFQPMKMG